VLRAEPSTRQCPAKHRQLLQGRLGSGVAAVALEFDVAFVLARCGVALRGEESLLIDLVVVDVGGKADRRGIGEHRDVADAGDDSAAEAVGSYLGQAATASAPDRASRRAATGKIQGPLAARRESTRQPPLHRISTILPSSRRTAALHPRGEYLPVDEVLRPKRPERYSELWVPLMRAAGVEKPVTLYCVRHGSVTRMLRAGVLPHIVAAWHGHSPLVMLSVYAHTDLADLQRAARALDASSTGREAAADAVPGPGAGSHRRAVTTFLTSHRRNA
jgi:hypothetical protein